MRGPENREISFERRTESGLGWGGVVVCMNKHRNGQSGKLTALARKKRDR